MAAAKTVTNLGAKSALDRCSAEGDPRIIRSVW